MGERKNSSLAVQQLAYADARATYEDLFQFRGAPYDNAMSLFPDARREEFLNAVRRAELCAGQTVADVPSGGGYLARYLPPGVQWCGHEPCTSFGLGGVNRQLLPLPWADGSADAAVSIAGVHHLADKRPLFAELGRIVREGGRFVLADVHEESTVSRFLDGWVDRNNSTGHKGVYLCDRTVDDLLNTGWQILSTERVPFHWRFEDRIAMGDFCNRLFDLRSCGPDETVRAIETDLGIDQIDGEVGMRWELHMIVATNALKS